MAICRFSDDSDVYVYFNVYGGIECGGCRLPDVREFNAKDAAEIVAHLEKHKALGHRVPSEAFEELTRPPPD